CAGWLRDPRRATAPAGRRRRRAAGPRSQPAQRPRGRKRALPRAEGDRMTQLHDLTVAQLAAHLREKKVSAAEAARHFLGRAQRHASLGAYLAMDEEVTLAQARAAD